MSYVPVPLTIVSGKGMNAAHIHQIAERPVKTVSVSNIYERILARIFTTYSKYIKSDIARNKNRH